jgi:hypothetical protein
MPSNGERNTFEREGRTFSHLLKAAAVINRGVIVVLDAGAAKAGAAGAGLVAVGIAEESADQPAGDTHVKAKLGCFLLANSATDAIAAADVGSDCFVEDDITVAKTDDTGSLSRAGKVRALSDGGVWVEFD